MVLPPKVWGEFFQKMFSREASISWAKKLWGGSSKLEGNDKIMPKWGEWG